VELGARQFEKAFGNAAERGLVEPYGRERWRLSKKGKRRLKERAEG
jgi:hypothetical protein